MASDSPMMVRLFGLKSLGSIVGSSSGAFAVGSAIGPIATGYIFDTTTSYQLAFLISAIFAAGGLAFAAVIRPTKRLQTRV